MSVLNWIMAHLAYIGFAVSEILVFVPSIKSNSVLQLIVNSLKSVADMLANAFGSNPPAPQIK